MADGVARETAALVALLSGTSADQARTVRAVLDAESAIKVLQDKFAGVLPIGEDPVEAAIKSAEADLSDWLQRGITAVSFFDERYPARLRSIMQMPPLIYVAGVPAEDHRAVAVVGSRDAAPDRLRVARHISATLADKGVTIVSGLARGIDTAAHTAALDAGGRTVAVIANGLDVVYPPENARLQADIADSGLVLSAYRPGTAPDKTQFLARNAIMSGYAAATIVVEAGHRSGARAQARMALEHGRPVIFPRHLLRHDWAQEYQQLPGVYIADDAAEVLAIVEGIVAALELTVSDVSGEGLFA